MQVQHASLIETEFHKYPTLIIIELIDLSYAVIDLPSDDGTERYEMRVLNRRIYEIKGLSYPTEMPQEQKITLAVDIAICSLFEICQIGIIG